LDFNDIGPGFPTDKAIHRLFEEQVERTPDQIALIGKNPESESPAGHLYGNPKHSEGTRGLAPLSVPASITYRQLNENANQLAHLLIEKGVGSDTIVGIMVDRSIEMIIGIFGILKAGGAYLPIDPEYPEKRIKYMLEDSGAKVLLTGNFDFHPSTLPILRAWLTSSTPRVLRANPKASW
jgi:non-ribosomal peptide synthetase component F